MANYKIVDVDQLDSNLTLVADAIRTKGNTTEPLAFPQGFADAVAAIKGSGGEETTALPPKDVNFRDYDGTILYSYTAAEAAALTALPALPTRPGLTCQGWNWSYSSVVDYVSKFGSCEVGAVYITDDGKTRIYVTLHEERLSPVLGCCPNGTVTVDWGDGTEPDVLSGTSTGTVQWTPNHQYAQPGSYVITLTVNGEVGFYGAYGAEEYSGILRFTAGSDARSAAIRNGITKIELGAGVTDIGAYAFSNCCGLASINIPVAVTSIGTSAFDYCASLKALVLPANIDTINTNIAWFCGALEHAVLGEGVTTVFGTAFEYCYSLVKVTLPSGVTYFDTGVFNECGGLLSVVIPPGVTRIFGSTFALCYSLKRICFKGHTSVPRLASASALDGVPPDCEIQVPASLRSKWISSPNWATFAEQIVGV